jgi:alpha-tubulin suppressor-like RCC1 family protein
MAVPSVNVKSSGLNDVGQLGNGSDIDNSFSPVSVLNTGVLSSKTVKNMMGPFGYNIFLVASDDKIYGWGQNSNGALGIGNTNPSNKPVAVGGMVSFRTMSSVVSNGDYALAIDASGKVYSWGDNQRGQLGDGTTVNRLSPVMLGGILGNKRIVSLTSSVRSSYGLDSLGKIYSWGANDFGQLGNGSTDDLAFPGMVYSKGVLTGKVIRAISGGSQFVVALDSMGALYTWGRGTEGQLGNGANISSSVPVKVDMTGVLAGKTIVEISAGTVSVLVRDSAGKLYAWGSNFYGTLGKEGLESSNVPIAIDMSGVLSNINVVSITSSFSDGTSCVCMVRDSNGKCYGWGTDYFGAFGLGSSVITFNAVEIFPGIGKGKFCATSIGTGYVGL